MEMVVGLGHLQGLILPSINFLSPEVTVSGSELIKAVSDTGLLLRVPSTQTWRDGGYKSVWKPCKSHVSAQKSCWLLRCC